MTTEEYRDIIDCIKFGCPAKAAQLITSLNNIIRNDTDTAISKQNIDETNNAEGDKQ